MGLGVGPRAERWAVMAWLAIYLVCAALGVYSTAKHLMLTKTRSTSQTWKGRGIAKWTDGDLSAERPDLTQRRRAALQGPVWPSLRNGCTAHPEQAAGLRLLCKDGDLRCSEGRR